ncbi:hypothetical protein [Candidatus Albibeggiatoa sp. nov. NOAA]|uniref:hypothetical protein n=1 Tax=Candidatus Albibeggiatoa sp. nov. NOAA TaxID=3162724 RepID=UPI0032F6BB17|nr:hypothetical protein [Thiotrichaceae bacterium]
MGEKFLKSSLLLLLVTAFLTMQWMPPHAHLSEQHKHDGIHHQHQAEIHAHSLVSQTIGVDLSHQVSHANIIALVHEYSFPKQEKPNSSSIIVRPVNWLLSFLLVNIRLPATTNTKLSYFAFSTVNPRAPPQIS